MKICYTLDLEADHDGVCSLKAFEVLKRLQPLEALIREKDVKLTCFVTGEVLDLFPDIIHRWQTMGIEFECHSYSHSRHPDIDQKQEIKKSFETYRKVLKEKPLGYRAPFGLISLEELCCVNRLGFRYDSSIFPANIPGQWRNRRFPTFPYFVEGIDLVEIPFSVLPIIRLPLCLGYIQLLGYPFYHVFLKIMNSFGILPAVIVFGFHLHDLFKTPNLNHLPSPMWKIYYLSNKLRKSPFGTFEKVINLFRGMKYESIYMSQLLQEVLNGGETKMGAQGVYLRGGRP